MHNIENFERKLKTRIHFLKILISLKKPYLKPARLQIEKLDNKTIFVLWESVIEHLYI